MKSEERIMERDEPRAAHPTRASTNAETAVAVPAGPLSPWQRWGARTDAVAGPLWVRRTVDIAPDPGATAGSAGVDDELLREAFEAVTGRHEVLRSSFHAPADCTPHSAAGAAPAWSVREVPEPLVEALDGILAAEVARLDPAAGAVLRALVVRLGTGRLRLVLTASALAADAVCLDLLFRAWAAAYDELAAGREVSHQEVLQAGDLALWADEMVRDEAGAPGRRHWLRRASAPPPALPYRHESAGSPDGPRVGSVALPPEVAEGARRLGAEADVPPESALLALWAVWLARMTGRTGGDRAAIAVRTTGRSFEELADAVAPLARTLPLEIGLPPGASVVEICRLARDEEREATSWQDVYDWDDPALAGALPAVGFAVEAEPPFPPLRFGGLTAVSSSREGRPVPADLVLTGDRTALRVDFDPERFSQPAVSRFAGQLAALARSASAGGGVRSWEELSLLDDDTVRRLTAAPESPATREPIHRGIVRELRRRPDAVAVASGARRLTGGELDRRSARLAAGLKSLGVLPEGRVALLLERGVDVPVAILGVMRAGAAYVPVDPDTPAPRVAHILDVSEASLLIVDREVPRELEVSPAVPVTVSLERLTGTPAIDLRIGREPDDETPVAPEGLAYVLFTSGSTGLPKGVAVSHRNLASYVDSARRLLAGVGPEEEGERGFAAVSTVAADLGNTAIFCSLASGGTLHLFGAAEAADPARFGEAMSRSRADLIKISTSHLRAMVEAEGARALPAHGVVLGGERLPAMLPAAIERAALQAGRPAPRLFNHYGPTEATIGSFARPVAGSLPEPWLADVPLGRPLAHAVARLVEPRGLEPVPAGVVGELLLGGAGVSRGSLGRSAETPERFVPDPWGTEPGARLYRTGDLARELPDGEILFVDRVDHQVKIRGHRVEPGEVEALLSGHPEVTAAAVVVVKAPGGGPRLAAYVVSGLRQEAGSETDRSSEVASHLRAWLRERLPEAMVPSTVTLLPALPLTINGKLDRRALPAPETEGGMMSGRSARTTAERVLRDAWREALRVEDVGLDDDFFELGGDSILSIRIVARARRQGIEITVSELFDHPTIARLAPLARRRETAGIGAASPVEGPVPLTPVQRRFFELEPPEPEHYNMSLLFQVRERPRADHLAGAVAILVARHDAFRLRFHRDGGGWSQRVAPDGGPIPFAVLDLTGMPPEARPREVERAADQVQRSLDLADGPIARVVHLRLGEVDRLLLLVHHLAIDAVSWRIVLEDLESAYRSLRRGEPPIPPPPSTPFSRWAERVVEHAGSEEVASEADLWLDRPTPVPRFPTASRNVVNDEGSACTMTVTLDRSMTFDLLQTIPSARGYRIHEIAVAGLVGAIRRWAGGDAVSIEIEGHGREDLFPDVDLSRTVGWFTTHTPLYVDLSETPGDAPLALAETVSRAYRRLPARGIGYGLLRHVARGEAAARVKAQPEPEIYFNYLGQLDAVLDEGSLFTPAPEEPGAERGARNPRSRPLGVHASVSDGRLSVVWTYASKLLRRETVEGLAKSFEREMERLVDACSRETEARSYTPEEFTDVELGQHELDAILGQLGDVEGVGG